MEIEVEKLATARIEMRTEDFRTGSRGLGSYLTIRMEDIERPYRKQKYLR
jgi:hypothetical protein